MAELERLDDRVRLERQQEWLRALLRSRAFALAEHLSRLRHRGEPILSRAWVRRVLGE